MAAKLMEVPDIMIDEEGKFKYVLMRLYVEPKSAGMSKLIVRGARWAPFHGKSY